MNRRGFIGTLAAAAIAPKLPMPEPEGISIRYLREWGEPTVVLDGYIVISKGSQLLVWPQSEYPFIGDDLECKILG